jgi:hypothetical protein
MAAVTMSNAGICRGGNSALTISISSAVSVVALLPATYAGDWLLTSVRAADGNGHAEPGRKGRRDRCRRATDQSRIHAHARPDDEASRHL